ncbi:MAG: geranylgeranylglyceryl/heptaprenylglyceryl phosphate synthase [Bacteroidales bacterium]|nr:geranylgeranylglyceryl/heptaprenylglyceryl phosphate synthase [Bacteroidales bacterium]
MSIYTSFLESKKANQKLFGVLIDPDKVTHEVLYKRIEQANKAGVDYFLVGGSLLIDNRLANSIELIKKNSDIPVVIFPGDNMQINNRADAILLLSLISGRNPEMLIGKHVIAAPHLKNSSLEILPTGYMLIESGNNTTALYMSHSLPIPADKYDIASCTAMAGEMLGLKIIYMDAGSGAQNPISSEMIKEVSENVAAPLIIGGGIRTPEKAVESCKAGADLIVVGNAIEKDDSFIVKMADAIHAV